MVSCYARNCCNRTEQGYRLFILPKSKERREKWLRNAKRNDTSEHPRGARLCEVHFEQSQFEANRKDGWKKLRPDAVPTLFDIAHPLKRLDHIKEKLSFEKKNNVCFMHYNSDKQQSTRAHLKPDLLPLPIYHKHSQKDDAAIISTRNTENNQYLKCDQHDAEIKALKAEIEELRKKMEKQEEKLKRFLNDDQIAALDRPMQQWKKESIIQGCKLLHALGMQGYTYLRSTNYPTPAYSTLAEHFCLTKLGTFPTLLEP